MDTVSESGAGAPANAVVVGYAAGGDEGVEAPADRALRRVVAWVAIIYGGKGLLLTAVHVGLARGWLASPGNMSWSVGETRREVVMMGVALTANCAMVVGGLLLLRRVGASISVLRGAVGVSLALSLVSQVLFMTTNPTYAQYWSTPGSAVSQGIGYLSGLWVPVLVGVLTVPVLARRMV